MSANLSNYCVCVASLGMGMDGDVSVHMTNTSRPHLMKTKRSKCCVLHVNFCLYNIMPVLDYSKLIFWSCNLNHPMSFIYTSKTLTSDIFDNYTLSHDNYNDYYDGIY